MGGTTSYEAELEREYRELTEKHRVIKQGLEAALSVYLKERKGKANHTPCRDHMALEKLNFYIIYSNLFGGMVVLGYIPIWRSLSPNMKWPLMITLII